MEFGNGSEVFSRARRIRLAIADDHPLVILAIERLAENFPNVEVVSRSANSTQLDESLARGDCDVALVDFHMPGGRYGDGIQLIQHIAHCYPDVRTIVLSRNDNAALVKQALDAGAHAFLSKEDRLDLVYVAIVSAIANETYLGPAVRRTMAVASVESRARFIRQRLTTRELEVIERYARGANVTEIAKELDRSVKTISAQKCAAMRKLDLSTDADLYRFIADSDLL
ncbi:MULTISPECIES: response regulator transcription factor [unclassified Caballeronia]|uniref:response regulator transcription factor n=1 Tax=unclassified Caballeronia TaxID=2646786 RepID=UPI001589AE78|nr:MULTISPECIES: response regulator transcription factor [unclassified Caballeronia]QSN61576.1 response regulator transcription factor [Caballeronia sp. M1242]